MSTIYDGQPSDLLPLPGTVNIGSSTHTSPIQVTTSTAHGLASGDWVQVIEHQTNTALNGTWAVTVTGTNTFLAATSVGNGAGGASGTVQSMAFSASTAPGGPGYAIPSDGDAINAASVNVALESLGDRTALLCAATGTLKFLTSDNLVTDDGALQTDVITSVSLTAPSTWYQLVKLLDWLEAGIQPTDTIEIDVTGTAIFTTGSGHDAVFIALFAAFYAAGTSAGTPAKLPGTAQTLSYGSTTTQFGGIHLKGFVTVPSGCTEVSLYLYAGTNDPGGGSCLLRGDLQVLVKAYRNTPFSGRIA